MGKGSNSRAMAVGLAIATVIVLVGGCAFLVYFGETFSQIFEKLTKALSGL